jgi:hypothetical protein
MRQRTEHEFSVAKRRVVGGSERHVVPAKTHGVPALFVRRSKGERKTGMLCDERAKLATGIAAGA